MSVTHEIKVRDVIEHEDGSATIEMDMSAEMKQIIFQEGFISLIEKYLVDAKKDESN